MPSIAEVGTREGNGNNHACRSDSPIALARVDTILKTRLLGSEMRANIL